ncbi:MAG: aminotransferase class III-fold pyridoxal phosphate-dependent enzyme, partial [Candidatus Bathyarchaeia archaeon]
MSRESASYKREEIMDMDKKFCLHGWGYIPIALVEGTGAVVKDINGKEYIDCLAQTAGVLGIGHTHPVYVKAVKEQLELISHTLTAFVNSPRAVLAKKLAEIAPGRLKNNCKTY